MTINRTSCFEHLILMMKRGELLRNVMTINLDGLVKHQLYANYFLTIGFVLTGNVITLELSNFECLFEYENDYRRNSCTPFLVKLRFPTNTPKPTAI